MTAPDQRNVRRWLTELAAGNRRWIQGAVLTGTLAGIATIVQMVLLARIIHLGVLEGVPASQLTGLFVALVFTLIVRAVFQGLQTRLAAQCSKRIRRSARRQIHRRWQASGPVAMGRESPGALAREWIDHVEALHGYYARFLPQMQLSVIVPLLILGLVFWVDWLAATFLLLSAPLIPLFMALVGMGAEKLNQQHFKSISRLSGQFLDKVRGLTTLQLFGQTEPAANLIARRSDQYRVVTMKTLKVAFLSSAVLEFFASVAIAVIAIYVGFGLLGYISFGPADELTLFSGLLILLLAPEFFQPLRTLSQFYHDRAAALGAGAEILARLHQGVEGPPPRKSVQSAPAAKGYEHVVTIDNVTLTHPGDQLPWFRNLNLTIEKGQAVALTGPSGGGKSSLLYLLAGFLAPDSGEIRVFGQAPGKAGFGWLGQKGFLVHGSWADNLRLTSPDASDIAIDTALRRVGLGDLVNGRKDGIYSEVSDQGRGLSGGEARRLSLARIFVADYDLILLDEPTAGLDSASEIFILESLRKLSQSGKTLIFSTHHHALLALADRVLTVDNGEVADA
ncbi:thiol reductant ABC exporter subunit CydD [Marinobacter pelagius]|uniref:thiol reductant ABC exporter subunit CydD n=1 Tax=Marinobacter sp. C7 TaxID=2951363 RepID=UPI001EEF8022|nr:thiol reductant ABC exporter subunit CydD [Marinobacter sp. C7]MCG7199629.1 thiol reductant ABC exporter subunit CydD [Marinobacter sp. C7]